MKSTLFIRSIKRALFLLALGFGVQTYAATPLAQFSSSKNQTITNPNALINITMGNNDTVLPTDDMNALMLDSQKALIISSNGYYFIVAAGQVGALPGSKAKGFVDIWLTQNDTVVPNSGCRQSVDQSSTTSVLVSQTIVWCNKGDKIGVQIAANQKDLGLIYTSRSSTPVASSEADIPSIIFSIFKL